MDIKVLASGSKGNCYRVSDGSTTLLLECGIPFKRIREGLDFKLSEVDACLVTHEHLDHSKAVKDIVKAGIDVYMSSGTKQAIGVESHRIKTVSSQEQFTVGTFNILPFETQHDAAEPLGFLIYSTLTHEKLLFATDTYFVKYRFPKLTHIMVECNYSAQLLRQAVEAGLTHTALERRITTSHFSLHNVLIFLQANDLSAVKSIILLHLSSRHGDGEHFKREVQRATGKQVYIAEKELEVEG